MAKRFTIDSYIKNLDGTKNPFCPHITSAAENPQQAVEEYFAQYPARFLMEGFGIRVTEEPELKAFIKRARQADRVQKLVEKEKEIAKLQKELEELRKPDKNA